MPRVAQTKKKEKKPSQRVASGDGYGFETILSVGVDESTSLNMQRKSPTTARTKSTRLHGRRRRLLRLHLPHQRSLPSQSLLEENTNLNNWQHWSNKKGLSQLFGKRGNLREWSLLMFLQARIPGHHLTRTAYPFVSSAMRNAFVLRPLHANHAVIEKHMYHLTTLVNTLFSLLKPSL